MALEGSISVIGVTRECMVRRADCGEKRWDAWMFGRNIKHYALIIGD